MLAGFGYWSVVAGVHTMWASSPRAAALRRNDTAAEQKVNSLWDSEGK